MKKADELSDLRIKAFLKASRQGTGKEVHISDGKIPGLSLWARKGAANAFTARWKYSYRKEGKSKVFGLGSYPAVSLQVARGQAAALRASLMSGKDPREEKRKAEAERKRIEEQEAHDAVTVGDLFEDFIRAQSSTWGSATYRLKETNRFKNHLLPTVGPMSIEAVTVNDVAAAISPIWQEKAETAKKSLSLLRKFFDWAALNGFRVNKSNPVDSRRIRLLIGARGQSFAHRPAMDYEEVPELFAAMAGQQGTAFNVLRFAILCNLRLSNALSLKWNQVDMEKQTLFFSASEMKRQANGNFTVYLSSQAVELLREQKRLGKNVQNELTGCYVFFSKDPSQHYSLTLIEQIMKKICREHEFYDPHESARLGRRVLPTVHGTARASFLTWVEATGKDRRAAERNLHHKTETAVGASYNREGYALIRRKLSQDWGDFCFSKLKI
ncbi:MAG: tyrosine-type recombinase/integrase [Mesosutterella sp.]|nr:tyrosine-type recombinase/integrase [Mesosutterella sp.]